MLVGIGGVEGTDVIESVRILGTFFGAFVALLDAA